jgi:hypothetical protein
MEATDDPFHSVDVSRDGADDLGRRADPGLEWPRPHARRVPRYQQLSVAQQGKAGALRKAIKPATILHEFQNKVATFPVADQPAALFALAATWPDRIRSANGYSVF